MLVTSACSGVHSTHTSSMCLEKRTVWIVRTWAPRACRMSMHASRRHASVLPDKANSELWHHHARRQVCKVSHFSASNTSLFVYSLRSCSRTHKACQLTRVPRRCKVRTAHLLSTLIAADLDLFREVSVFLSAYIPSDVSAAVTSASAETAVHSIWSAFRCIVTRAQSAQRDVKPP